MSTLDQLAPAVEVYSIDEAFLDLSGVEHAQSLTELRLSIRQTIQDWIGITVCVGIAPSKTLAQLEPCCREVAENRRRGGFKQQRAAA